MSICGSFFMKKAMSRFFFVVTFLTLTSGLRVGDRFKHGRFDMDFKCKILSLKQPEQQFSATMTTMFNWYLSYWNVGIQRFNSCIIDANGAKIVLGQLVDNSTNTYDGAIGLLQRDEYQMYTVAVKASLLKGEPVHVGPVLMPSDMSVMSIRPRRLNETVSLDQFIYEMDKITYAYIGIVLLLTSITITIVFYLEWPRRCKELKLKKFFKRLTHHTYHIAMAQLNQILPLRGLKLPSKLIWTSVIIFVFVLIFNLFLSLIRSSYVVTRQPPFIRSVQDLVESFKNVTPIIFDGAYYMDTFKFSGDKYLQEVVRRAKANPDIGLFEARMDFRPDDMQSNLPKFMAMFQGKAAMLIDERYVPQWRTGTCSAIGMLSQTDPMYAPDIPDRFTATNDLFAPGILNVMMSHKTDKFFKDYMHYYFKTNREFGLFNKMLRDCATTVPFENSISQWGLYKCLDREEVELDVDDHEPLEFWALRKFLRMIAQLFALAFGILFFEIVVHKIIPKRKPKARKTWARRTNRIKVLPILEKEELVTDNWQTQYRYNTEYRSNAQNKTYEPLGATSRANDKQKEAPARLTHTYNLNSSHPSDRLTERRGAL